MVRLFVCLCAVKAVFLVARGRYDSAQGSIMHVHKVINSTWLISRLPQAQRQIKLMEHAYACFVCVFFLCVYVSLFTCLCGSWAIPSFGPLGMKAFDDRKHCIEVFNKHVDEVKRVVPKDRLLCFDVKQGWGPLCAFLNKTQPKTPFPKGNETAQFEKRFRMMKTVDGVLVACVGVALAAAAYYCKTRWF